MRNVQKPARSLVGYAALLFCLCLLTCLSVSGSSTQIGAMGNSFFKSLTPFNDLTLNIKNSVPQAPQILSLNNADFNSDLSKSASMKETMKLLEGSNVLENVQDLVAVNDQKRRDLVYNSSVNDDSNSSINLEISGNDPLSSDWQSGTLSDGSDVFDESAFPVFGDQWPPQKQKSNVPGNYMNIEVSHINVIVLNNVSGGSAVATSNIIISPVQYITYPSEVEEKIK